MRKSWESRRIGDVCEIVNGGTPKTSVAKYWGDEHLWITPAEMGKRESPYVDDTKRKLTDSGLRDSSARMLPAHSVILSSRAPIGHLVINTKPMATNQGCKSLIPGKLIEYKFLYYYLSSIVDLLESLGTGATFKELSGSKLKEVDLPVPPLPEQKRIVAVLDKAFEGLVTAKANAEKNLQNARDLFESHLQSVFTHHGKGWVEKTLGEAFDVRDGTHDSPKYHTTGYPLITSKNLKREGLSFDDVKLISKQDYAKINERSAVHKGDVLFAMIGTIGNATLVEVEPNFAIKNVALFKNSKGQSSAFLKHYLDSRMVISKMLKEAKGTTQKFVGLGYLRNFPIKLPPVSSQLQIVKELDAVSAEIQRLTRIYEQKLAALEALKKSLLHQAFTGRL
jgi:type I restriction enzyme S subunit